MGPCREHRREEDARCDVEGLNAAALGHRWAGHTGLLGMHGTDGHFRTGNGRWKM
jgi:hypothetical protein